MLSKSKGQVLRVSAALHVLFQVTQKEESTSEEESSAVQDGEDFSSDDNCISEKAIAAAINFVTVCCQQTAFIAGRGNIEEEIEIIQASE